MLLAIDTATQTLSIALHDGEALEAEWSLRAGRRHSALLAPMLQRMMTQIGIDSDDLAALAVAVGPGSYTGARIGVALAKGMSAPRDLPLVGVTTLETVLVAKSPPQDEIPLVATVSAGRDRVIWAAYRWQAGDWREWRLPKISQWPALLAEFDQPVRFCGEVSAAGLASIREAQAAGADIKLAPAVERVRRAGWLAEVAWRRLRESGADAFPADRVMPVYLMSP